MRRERCAEFPWRLAQHPVLCEVACVRPSVLLHRLVEENHVLGGWLEGVWVGWQGGVGRGEAGQGWGPGWAGRGGRSCENL